MDHFKPWPGMESPAAAAESATPPGSAPFICHVLNPKEATSAPLPLPPPPKSPTSGNVQLPLPKPNPISSNPGMGPSPSPYPLRPNKLGPCEFSKKLKLPPPKSMFSP